MIGVDLFAGAGGFSLGLEQAGIPVALAVDNDPVAVSTHEKNLTSTVIEADLADSDPKRLLEEVGLTADDVDLVVGGPPCQGFSLQRRGPRGDPRNRLVLSFVDFIATVVPNGFLMENVPAIRTRRGASLLEFLHHELEPLGYTIEVRTLNALDFGVAQVRKRVFVQGILHGRPVWPSPSDYSGPKTVRECLQGLPSPPIDGSPHSEVANHYRERRLSATNIERIKHVPQGGGREYLPEHLQLDCHKNGHRHLDTYGRLAWDAPSVTLTARFDSFTRGKFGHPEEHRSITLREGARLQGFPDSFVFDGTREDGARLIGNAVPPPLGRALGESIRTALGQS